MKQTYTMVGAIEDYTEVKRKYLVCPECGHKISYVSKIVTPLFTDEEEEEGA